MALGKLGILHLLDRLYDEILIPSAVHHEVVVRGLELGQPDAYIVQLAVSRREISIIQLSEDSLIERIRSLPLGLGEKSTIQLGINEAADWLILDDLLAREEAHHFGLRVKGSIGVISDAYRKGFINRQERDLVFQSILTRDDIWIGDKLVQYVWDELRKMD